MPNYFTRNQRSPILFLFFILITGVQAKSQGINITSGANVVVNGAGMITINGGNFNNDGTFTASTGSVLLTGANAATVGGTSTTSFNILGINKTAALKLMQNIGVSGNVTLTANNIDLNGFNLNLGSSGSLSGENASSYITTTSGGFVTSTAVLNNPSAVNPGNIGVEITSAANLGSTLIKRGEQQQVTSSGHSINRFFDFVPTNNTALNATVKFYYLDAELAGIPESELKQWSSADNGVTWVLLGSNAQDVSLNFITKNNINTLNRLTLASSITSPLPLKLISFTGRLVKSDVLLNWTTSNEINSNYFDVERSSDASSFAAIGKVNAAGLNGTGSYNFTDFDIYTNVKYYRLKMVDNDGRFTYSKVIMINRGTYSNNLESVYPNPTQGPVNIEFTANSAMKGTLVIRDIDGKTIFSKVVDIQKGMNKLQYDLGNSARGTYLITLSELDDKTIKIIKY